MMSSRPNKLSLLRHFLLADTNRRKVLHCISPSLIDQGLLISKGNTYRHSLLIRLGIHRLALLTERGEQLEVVDIVCRRKRVEEFRFPVKRVLEGVWTAGRNSHEVSRLRIHDVAIKAPEAECALCDQEAFVVHLVPVRRWPINEYWKPAT